jgi:hypothetical protein
MKFSYSHIVLLIFVSGFTTHKVWLFNFCALDLFLQMQKQRYY